MGNCFREIIYNVSPHSWLFKIKDCVLQVHSFTAEVNSLKSLLRVYNDITGSRQCPVTILAAQIAPICFSIVVLRYIYNNSCIIPISHWKWIFKGKGKNIFFKIFLIPTNTICISGQFGTALDIGPWWRKSVKKTLLSAWSIIGNCRWDCYENCTNLNALILSPNFYSTWC